MLSHGTPLQGGKADCLWTLKLNAAGGEAKRPCRNLTVNAESAV